VIFCTEPIEQVGQHGVRGRIAVQAGQKAYLSLQFGKPEEIDGPVAPPDLGDMEKRLQETIKWWRAWSGRGRLDSPDGPSAVLSAMVLKGLTHAPTGAMIAAATTSLPEALGGGRNWDYRFSWIRD